MNEYVVIFNEKLTAFAWKSKSTLISLFYLFFLVYFGFCTVNSLIPGSNDVAHSRKNKTTSWVVNMLSIDTIVFLILHVNYYRLDLLQIWGVEVFWVL